MVAGALLEYARTVIDTTAFGIVGPEKKSADARKRDGRGAHWAGLQGDIKIAGAKPWPSEFSGPFLDQKHFRVGRGVTCFLDPVSGSGNYRARRRIDQNRADRNLAAQPCRPGLFERMIHI